jgi:hypothetical protein
MFEPDSSDHAVRKPIFPIPTGRSASRRARGVPELVRQSSRLHVDVRPHHRAVEQPNGTLKCDTLPAGGDLITQNAADPPSHLPRWAEEEATWKPCNGSRHCAHLLVPQRTLFTNDT